jgi:hypothetical protein
MNKLWVAGEQAVGNARVSGMPVIHPQSFTRAPQLFQGRGARQASGGKSFSELSRRVAALISYY